MRQVLLFFLLLLCANSYAMETDQAYRLIPHQRTVFQLHQSAIPATEAQQVAKLLLLAEKAMVERVDAMVNGAGKTGYLPRIDSILWQIDQLRVPIRVQAARDHIHEAVQQHRTFFELQNVTGNQVEANRQQLVQSSHRHLVKAYRQLLQTYPEETKHNKQAFFDYLCALDFI
ncbi:MAG: hypothetical protein GY875_25320 [Gammaproteobacteria bacterium]|nr:hypothetical protein [Gammaproteobacteria bacterium]